MIFSAQNHCGTGQGSITYDAHSAGRGAVWVNHCVMKEPWIESM